MVKYDTSAFIKTLIHVLMLLQTFFVDYASSGKAPVSWIQGVLSFTSQDSSKSSPNQFYVKQVEQEVKVRTSREHKGSMHKQHRLPHRNLQTATISHFHDKLPHHSVKSTASTCSQVYHINVKPPSLCSLVSLNGQKYIKTSILFNQDSAIKHPSRRVLS